jgi:hypothetical protein
MPTSSGYQSLDFKQCKLKADGCIRNWAGSLAGRARLLHRRGREFESLPVHQKFFQSVFRANPLVREGLP